MNAPQTTPSLPAGRNRRGGLVQEVVQHLQQLMQSGQIQAGDKLPTESAIMGDMSVSRTVVREAISRLQASGQVETRHGIGTFALQAPTTHNFRIAEQDMATLDDVIAVLELRISLETEAAGLAAQRATPEQLTAMAAALHGFSMAIHNQSDAVPSDFLFHMEIAKATGNRHFADLMTYLGTHIIPRTRIKTRRPRAGKPIWNACMANTKASSTPSATTTPKPHVRPCAPICPTAATACARPAAGAIEPLSCTMSCQFRAQAPRTSTYSAYSEWLAAMNRRLRPAPPKHRLAQRSGRWMCPIA
jgi:GntR family transcriptional repressor for pyruvate dehydrogenase complex